MSTNIRDLVDRVYREYLEPMDDLQPYSLLTSSLTDSADTVSFNGDLLTQEEFDIIKNNIKIFSIPGPSAVTTAVAASGFSDKYFFLEIFFGTLDWVNVILTIVSTGLRLK